MTWALIFLTLLSFMCVPAEAETYGETERIIGTWFKKTGSGTKYHISK